ncbi:MAG: ATP-binding protein [Peptococcaceae bacterium]|nr:MAG: ATP-binding protein [Peptococcaceae bacterium]
MIIKRKPSFPAGESVGKKFTVRLCIFCADEIEVYTGALHGGEKAQALVYRLKDSIDAAFIFKAYEMFARGKGFSGAVIYEENIITMVDSTLAYIVLQLPGMCLREAVSSQNCWPAATVIDFGVELCRLVYDLESVGITPALAPEFIWVSFENDSPGLFLPVIYSLARQGNSFLKFASQDAIYSNQIYLIGLLLTGLLNGKFPEPFESKFENPGTTRSEILPPALNDTLTRCLYSATNRQYKLPELISDLETCRKETAQNQERKTDLTESQEQKQGGLAKVAGMQKLKELLIEEVVGPIKNPSLYQRFGLTWPNGILLFGPPGCGKTYISRQLAEEIGFYFVELVPSEVASAYIHETTRRIRDVFRKAKKNAPAIIFIDELDAMVPVRSSLGGHQDYKSEEITEFLVQLNDCAKRGILVIAATNEPEKIDPAVLRTGRIDKFIFVGLPDEEARKALLEMYLHNRPVVQGLDLLDLSKKLEGYSCSDIKNLVDEAARLAVRGKALNINEFHFLKAIKRNPPGINRSVLAKYAKFKGRGGE